MAILTGSLLDPQGNPVTEGFTITLYDLGIVQSTNQIFLGSSWSVQPNLDGSFTVDLWNNLEADNTANYQVEHPNGVTYNLSIPANITTGNYTDYIKHTEVDSPGVLVRLKTLEGASAVVLEPRIELLELGQTTQDGLISNIQTALGGVQADVASNTSDLGQLPGIQTSISSLSSQVSTLEQITDTVPGAINTQAGQIADLQVSVSNKVDQTQLTSIDTRVTDIEPIVALFPGVQALSVNNLVAIEGVDSRLVSVEQTTSGIPVLESDVLANTNQISSNSSTLATKANQTDLSSLTTAYNNHIHTGTVWTQSQIPDLPISKITSLQGTLNNKTDIGHTHSWDDLPMQEGVFSPYLQGTGWGYTSEGKYYKKGKLVLIYAKVSIGTVGSDSLFQVLGLPFYVEYVTWISFRIRGLQNLPSNYDFSAYCVGTFIRPQYIHGSTATTANIDVSQLTSSTELWFSGVYKTND